MRCCTHQGGIRGEVRQPGHELPADAVVHRDVHDLVAIVGHGQALQVPPLARSLTLVAMFNSVRSARSLRTFLHGAARGGRTDSTLRPLAPGQEFKRA